MKRILLPALAAALLSTTAMAADLPGRGAAIAPAPVYNVVPAFTWSGFYVGGQVGYGWSTVKGTEFDVLGAVVARTTVKPTGFFGGLHAGYNAQTGSLVYGLEVDGDLSGVEKNSFATIGVKADESWRASARLRLGFAFDRALIYGTGGLAAASTSYTITDGAGTFARAKDTQIGWTLGGGLEFAFNNNWSARTEYRYTDLGDGSFGGLPVAFAPVARVRYDTTDHSFRAGVSYRFGGGTGSVVAKY